MNLLQLRNWLQNQTLIPASDEVVNGYINQAYLELATAHDWPWLETTHSFNQEASTAEYAFPADLNRLRAVIYSAQGAEAQPTRTTREAVLARYGADVGESDLPTQFYRQNQNLVFVPTPSGTQEVVLLYQQRPTELAGDEDEPAFDPAFHIILVHQAAALYFESEESFDYASFYESKAAGVFVAMAQFYDMQLPPEQPFVLGGQGWVPRRRPFVGWETSSGV